MCVELSWRRLGFTDFPVTAEVLPFHLIRQTVGHLHWCKGMHSKRLPEVLRKQLISVLRLHVGPIYQTGSG